LTDVSEALTASIIKAMSPDNGGSKNLSNLVNLDQTPWRNIPEENHLHTRRRENLKS
jgi:hypothetical protein